MKIKISYFEKMAGLFIVGAIALAVVLTLATALEKKWFSSKDIFYTHVESADGIRQGTMVHMAGLVVGEVAEVSLTHGAQVKLTLAIDKKFSAGLKEDSVARVTRPSVLGEKVIELSLGSEGAKALAIGASIPLQDGYDIMDLVSGKKLAPFMSKMDALMLNLSTLVTAFSDPKRTQAFIRMFDRVDPLINNMNKMSIEVAGLAHEANQLLPQMRKASPEIARQMAEFIERLNALSGSVEPAMKEIGPELPRVSRRAIEALDEMVVTLKALQKSFILSGKVDDVRSEEAHRKPATKY
jgi:phospholipid/cholesterol/gamma-HCH transport system substrate-binding protein